MTLEDELEALEVELLTSSTRRDRDRVALLLHPDFVEIGRSGRRWTREAMIASLGAEDARPTPPADEWEFAQPAIGLVLVTYRLRRDGSASRHTSLWDVTTDPFSLRFHQGTPITEPER